MAAKLALRPRKPVYHCSRPLQCLQYGSVLNALLQDALHPALCRAYVTGDASHLAHIDFTQDKEARHNADNQASQPTVHVEEVDEGTHEAIGNFKQGGKCLCDAVR